MLENSIFNIAPKKPVNFVVTKKKFIIGLVIFMAFFTMFKIHSTGGLKKELFRSKIYVLLASIKDINDTTSFNTNFTVGDFCGWEVDFGGGRVNSSKDYATTSANGELFKQEFDYQGSNTTLSLCIANFDKFDREVTRQLLVLFLVSGLIVFLLIYTKFVDDDEEEKQNASQKISNS